jgi:hypothetical protein
MEGGDGNRAVQHGQERADNTVISTVWEAASGQSDAMFQAFPFFLSKKYSTLKEFSSTFLDTKQYTVHPSLSASNQISM